jgi:outer membrane protein TolC
MKRTNHSVGIVHLAAVALVCLALSGCLDQKKDVNLYRKVLDKGSPPATQPSGPLTLLEALSLTNANNDQLAISGEDYLQSLIQKDRAVSAFLPVVNLQPSYFRMEAASFGPTPLPMPNFAPRQTFDIPINAGMNVFNGFRDVAALRQAAANADARKALLLDLQATILVETAQVYYEILSLEAQARVLDDTIRVRDQRVRLIDNQRKAGVARMVDLEQAQAQASEARVLRLQAQSRIVTGRAALAQLMGVPTVPNALVDDLQVPAAPPEPALEKTALDRREDLAAAIAGVQAAQQSVQQAIGEYYPSVTIDFNYYFKRQTFPSVSKWNALLAANIPIFQGGQIEADVRTAWSQLRQALLRKQQVQRQIARDVQVAFSDLRTAGLAIDQLTVQVTAARGGYAQASQAYKYGTARALEALIAQNQVLAAELQLVNQQYQRKLTYLTLLRVTGQLGFDQPPLKAAHGTGAMPPGPNTRPAPAS